MSLKSIRKLLRLEPESGNTAPTRDYGATGSSVTIQPPASKTSTPAKVEPKVYLAAERTLLNWLRVALLIGTFSIALVNSAKHSTGNPLIGKIFGVVYAVIGAGTIVYAYRVFETRRRHINERYPGHFDEPYGPVILCVVLFTAVLLNFIFQATNRSGHLPTPKNPWVAAYLGTFVTFKA